MREAGSANTIADRAYREIANPRFDLGRFLAWLVTEGRVRRAAGAWLLERLDADDLARESDGALIVHVEQQDDKKEMPPLLLTRSRSPALTTGRTMVLRPTCSKVLALLRSLVPLRIQHPPPHRVTSAWELHA